MLLSAFLFPLFSAQAEDVVRLEAITGGAEEYEVSELLHVEFTGDSILFIASDGSLTAQVYKYDYVRLVVTDKSEEGIAPTDNPSPVTARKVLINGEFYILFGEKAYRLSGQEVKNLIP